MTIARGGRLPKGIDAAMRKLNTSVQLDQALWREDIRGSIAHARGLGRAGVLSELEVRSIVSGLESVKAEIESGQFTWSADLEDVHMNIEARLVELIGPVGGKLHTGRSRNDQVATDLRLWTRGQIDVTLERLHGLAEVLLRQAEEEIDTLMPAYTHLQPAQPSRLSHHLLAWQEMLLRDRGRLQDARARLNESPLGAGAVAGTGFPIDRDSTAADLGFASAMRNSLDATASRDFLMETASALAILGVHLSRIGEEIVIWSSLEFGYLTLSDEFATSSSMMPQKKNPDVGELVRGKCSLVIGDVTSLYVLEKSLCFGYGRDLQEDKRPIFEAFDAVQTCLGALSGAISTAEFHRGRMRAALASGHICATDLADWMVRQGATFREAHAAVGQLVREAEERSCQLAELPEEILDHADSRLSGPELHQVLDASVAVERRRVLGGPARERVLEALISARALWSKGTEAR